MTESRTRSIDSRFSEARVLRGMEFTTKAVLVAERYELLRRIGSGAYGVVYEALDRDLRRRVAIKVLDLGDPETARHEGQVLAELEHPNVVKIFDHGQGPDYRYFVLQLLEGPTLREWCLSKSPAEIISKFVEAGRGLEAAHARYLVHRDFKPANVRIGPHGQAVVVDFGLARHLDSVGNEPSERDCVVGTMAYTAPERLAGRPGDALSDQFSFCVALWEALSGRNPFGPATEGTTPDQRLRAIGSGRRGEPRGPAHVRRAIERGLSPAPRDRWRSMSELLHAIAPPARQRSRAFDFATASASIALLGLVVGQLRTQHRPSVDSHFVRHVLREDVTASAHLRRGDVRRALAILEDAERSRDTARARRLAETSRRVAIELESSGEWADAVSAWMLSIRFARDAHDAELERVGQQRLYEAAAMVQKR